MSLIDSKQTVEVGLLERAPSQVPCLVLAGSVGSQEQFQAVMGMLKNGARTPTLSVDGHWRVVPSHLRTGFGIQESTSDSFWCNFPSCFGQVRIRAVSNVDGEVSQRLEKDLMCMALGPGKGTSRNDCIFRGAEMRKDMSRSKASSIRVTSPALK